MLPKNILAPTDFSPLSQAAVDSAFVLARRAGAHVHLLHVFAPVPSYELAFSGVHAPEIIESERLAANARMKQMAPPGVAFTCDTRYGYPSREILLAAEKADLIVVATHGYGAVRRALFGSVSATVVRSAKVPVLVVGEHRKLTKLGSVVAGVDLSPVSKDVLAFARSYADPGVTVDVISVLEMPLPPTNGPVSQMVRQEFEGVTDLRRKALLELIPQDGGTQAQVIEARSAAAAIIEAAQSADLLVIGTSGHNAWQRALLGSTATRVLSEATCPVLVVPNTHVAA